MRRYGLPLVPTVWGRIGLRGYARGGLAPSGGNPAGGCAALCAMAIDARRIDIAVCKNFAPLLTNVRADTCPLRRAVFTILLCTYDARIACTSVHAPPVLPAIPLDSASTVDVLGNNSRFVLASFIGVRQCTNRVKHTHTHFSANTTFVVTAVNTYTMGVNRLSMG